MSLLHDLIKRFEGLRLKAYFCPAGVVTLGYGSAGPDIKMGMIWTKEQAIDRMYVDAEVFLTGAKSLCPTLVGDRLDAVADFAYNLGLTRLKGSTLRRKLNAGDMAGARAELLKWVRGGGRILPGLVIRRAVEAKYL